MSGSLYAIVTLLTSDTYLPGVLTLLGALNDLHPLPADSPEVAFQTVCLITPQTVGAGIINFLREKFDSVVAVDAITLKDRTNLDLLGRPDLHTVLTKLHVFRLTQFDKILFLDADVLPVRPLSHLLTLSHEFSAVPDIGWPDMFNSGVLVLTPGQDKFDELQKLLDSQGSWDGGDQGLLNEWRGDDWHKLSFVYNTTMTVPYTNPPAFKRYGSGIKAIHFIGPNKPWFAYSNRSPFMAPSDSHDHGYDTLVDQWFKVFDTHYRSDHVVSMTGPKVQGDSVSLVNSNTSDSPSTALADDLKIRLIGKGTM